MNIIILKDKYEVGKKACDLVSEVIKNKSNAILGLATGSSPITLYEELIRRNREGEIDFKDVITFNLDEYIGLKGNHEKSYRTFMNINLFDHINIKKENTFIPNGDTDYPEYEAQKYESLLRSYDNIDIQILGIGRNGHIGFNEPNETLINNTHVAKLKKSTIEANSRFFKSMDEVPKLSITMGMGSIMRSKKIVLLAIGDSKKEIIGEFKNQEVSCNNPSSFLKLHNDVTIICDEAAGALLLRE